MDQHNPCLQALGTYKGKSFGLWQMLPSTHVSRALAAQDVDWILVDCEHGNIDDSAMHEAVQTIAACHVSPIVRVPATDGWMMKRALDTGAHGLMVPLLRTVQEVEQVVRFCKFPPQGVRGWGSPFAVNAFRNAQGKPTISSTEYLRQANQALLTIIQIETVEALECVEDIAGVPGVDVLFAGPFDLANSMGVPMDQGVQEPQLKAALERILAAATSAGKKSGIYCGSGEVAKQCSEMGFHMISCMTDIMALPATAGQSLKLARGQN